MKIVSWNCNGAFRTKFNHLIKLNGDIYIIQECENPTESNHKDYKEWARNYLWIGDKKHKGLGIFASEKIQLTHLNWSNVYKENSVKYFLPCLVNNDFQLLGIWTHQNSSPNFGYIGQLWKYLQVNQTKLGRAILVGDLNSNSIWDEWDRWWNHSDVVKQLIEIGIESLYHKFFREEQGKETQPTFFMHRKANKPYHIDYCFASQEISNNLENFTVGNFEEWKLLSDHVPIIAEFNL